jgi:hypothetical protein
MSRFIPRGSATPVNDGKLGKHDAEPIVLHPCGAVTSHPKPQTSNGMVDLPPDFL